MRSVDWQTSIPRSPDVGRLQQVAQGQGEATQERLARLGWSQENRAARIKESAGPEPARGRKTREEGGRRRGRGQRERTDQGSGPPGHLDITV